MKYTIILLSICLSNFLYSQSIDIPRSTIGLKISVTGVSICMLGVSMKTHAVKTYNPTQGYSYTRIETTIERQRTQLTTFEKGFYLNQCMPSQLTRLYTNDSKVRIKLIKTL